MGSRHSMGQGGIVAALVGFALAGCSGSPSAPPDSGITNPEFVRSVRTPSGAFSSTGDQTSLSGSTSIDGAVGGQLSVGRFKLVFPKGAFLGRATVSITVPDTSVVRCDLSIDPPSANRFAVPVTLSSDCRGTNVVVASRLVTVWLDESTGLWRPVPGSTPDAANVSVRAPLRHFSLYGVLESKAGW